MTLQLGPATCTSCSLATSAAPFYCPEAGNSWKTWSERTLLLSDRRRSFRRAAQLASKALMFMRKRLIGLSGQVWSGLVRFY